MRRPERKPKPAAAHLPVLTGLRSLLALWVVIHHISGRGQMMEGAALAMPAAVYSLIRGGYLAVATFFVLSGFVLAHNYATTVWTGRSLLRYGTARVARVYPVYLLSLLVIAPFILADRVPGKGGLLVSHAVLVQGWFGRLPVGWNTPAWSLSCEIFFYAAFPFAAAALRHAGWRSTIAAAVLACGLSRALAVLGLPDGVKPVVHLADFLMGVAAARIYQLTRLSGRGPRGAWLYVPASFAGLAVIAYPALLPARVDVNSVLRPLNGVILVGLALGGGAAARILSSPLAVYLGKASYAMYILHVPLLWWYLRWTWPGSPLLYVASVIAISALVYSAVEEPANRGLRGLVRRSG